MARRVAATTSAASACARRATGRRRRRRRGLRGRRRRSFAGAGIGVGERHRLAQRRTRRAVRESVAIASSAGIASGALAVRMPRSPQRVGRADALQRRALRHRQPSDRPTRRASMSSLRRLAHVAGAQARHRAHRLPSPSTSRLVTRPTPLRPARRSASAPRCRSLCPSPGKTRFSQLAVLPCGRACGRCAFAVVAGLKICERRGAGSLACAPPPPRSPAAACRRPAECSVLPFGKSASSCWRDMRGQARTLPVSVWTKGEPERG